MLVAANLPGSILCSRTAKSEDTYSPSFLAKTDALAQTSAGAAKLRKTDSTGSMLPRAAHGLHPHPEAAAKRKSTGTFIASLLGLLPVALAASSVSALLGRAPVAHSLVHNERNAPLRELKYVVLIKVAFCVLDTAAAQETQ